MSEDRSSDGAQTCWVLAGPTASGKTAVALELARRHSLEVVSVDSMQVYRGMDTGTAKPAPEDRALVPHHMIDVLDPDDGCSAGLFCRMAAEAIEAIRARGNRPLLVGGTPLYLKGLLWGLMDGPGSDPALRSRLQAEAAGLRPGALHARLSELDPAAAARIHPNDVHRLVRALEVRELTGTPISVQQVQFDGPPRLPHIMVGLRRLRRDLYARIDARVDRMMEAGLLAEVRSLKGRLGREARQAVGYKELTAYLEGTTTLADAVRLIKRNTRRYAKHQLTWFQHFPQVRWVDAAGFQSACKLAERCAVLFVQHTLTP